MGNPCSEEPIASASAFRWLGEFPQSVQTCTQLYSVRKQHFTSLYVKVVDAFVVSLFSLIPFVYFCQCNGWGSTSDDDKILFAPIVQEKELVGVGKIESIEIPDSRSQIPRSLIPVDLCDQPYKPPLSSYICVIRICISIDRPKREKKIGKEKKHKNQNQKRQNVAQSQSWKEPWNVDSVLGFADSFNQSPDLPAFHLTRFSVRSSLQRYVVWHDTPCYRTGFRLKPIFLIPANFNSTVFQHRLEPPRAPPEAPPRKPLISTVNFIHCF